MSTSPPQPAPEEQGSPLLAILVGIAILGVAAFFIFGSSDSASSAVDASGKRGGGDQASSQAKRSAVDGSAKVRGGIEARDFDEAQGRAAEDKSYKRNPALGAPLEGLHMLPNEPKKPETFATKAEEITFYEQKLGREQVILEKRGEFLDRVKKIRAEAKTPEEREVAESRGKIVETNFEEQQKVVAELERKLSGLKGE